MNTVGIRSGSRGAIGGRTSKVWIQSARNILFSLVAMYLMFALYMFGTTGETQAFGKSLFIFLLAASFPVIALFETAYAVVVVLGFAIALFSVTKWVPVKYMRAFFFLWSLGWVISGYILMMFVTGGA